MAVILIVEQGDISEFSGDAIVNAANNYLVMGIGVAGAIATRGGPEIQRECSAYVKEHGEISVGDAVVTGAGELDVRWVIHAAVMGEEPVTEASIRGATSKALRLAVERDCASVAFPILGTGVGRYPFEQAANLMVESIRTVGEELDPVMEVVLYGYTPENAATLRRLILES